MKVLVIYQPQKCRLEERPVPAVSRPDQVLIRVRAVGICGSDMATWTGAPTRKLPLIPCHEFAGEVAELGSGVKKFKKGDRVVVEPMLVCGKCYACRLGRPNVCRELQTVGSHCDGAVQEYFLTTQDKLHPIPEPLSFQQATLIEPFSIAAQVCQRLQVRAGDRVLIHGAGPIGLVTLLAAKQRGAAVAISEVSDGRRALAQELGADLVTDPLAQPLEDCLAAFTDGNGVDVVVDSAGLPAAVGQAVGLANEGARIGNLCFGQVEVPFDAGQLVRKRQSIRGSRLQAGQFPRVLAEYGEALRQAGRIITDVFPLERADEAFQLFGSRKPTTGKIVITLNG